MYINYFEHINFISLCLLYKFYFSPCTKILEEKILNTYLYHSFLS